MVRIAGKQDFLKILLRQDNAIDGDSVFIARPHLAATRKSGPTDQGPLGVCRRTAIGDGQDAPDSVARVCVNHRKRRRTFGPPPHRSAV